MQNRLVVTSADFIRNIGYWQGEALRQPVAITHHGRERLILAAPDHFNTTASDASAPELAGLRATGAALLENIDAGYLRFDARLSLQAANGVAESFTGRARDTLVGQTVFQALPDPIASVLADRLQRVVRTRKIESFECGVFDGRHVSVRVFPVSDGVAALFNNVTEQHEMRHELESSAALQRALQAHGDMALIRLDARARIEDTNHTFFAWTGFQPEDLFGHRLSDLAAGSGRRDLAAALERVLREAAPLQLDVALLGKRGDEVLVKLAAAPILTDFAARGAQVILTRHEDADRGEAAA